MNLLFFCRGFKTVGPFVGKTYQDIASRPNEWLRQWARIILVVERGLSPQQRLNMQKKYSQLRGKRTIIKIWKTTVNFRDRVIRIGEIESIRRFVIKDTNETTPQIR
ncbi:unnamed protein product [Oppiella nova]|uniref:Uncharacterized protein n=1 Tax=Oppiella nova TaxID=334625 RepID=A0A7R9LE33_9ACAR|nr:unnamed protein product [Oppiella nova]CAG2162728.1 unnamed protein product [Oppiella nova]